VGDIVTSHQFRINLNDLAKGLIVAGLTPPLFILQAWADGGVVDLTWKHLLMSAASGFIAYLIKNFFTPSQTTITGDTDIASKKII